MFAATTLALLLTAQPPGTHLPRWRLNEGDTLFHKSVTVTEVKVDFAGQMIEQKSEATVVVRFKIVRAPRECMVIEMEFLECEVRGDNPSGAAGPDKLKGATFTITLDDRMRVTKFDGYDKFVEAAAGTDAEKLKLLRMGLPEPVVRKYFEQAFLCVPPEGVAVGGKWEQGEEYPFEPLGSLLVKNTCKLEDVTADIATITQTGAGTWKAKSGELDGGVKFSKVDIKPEKITATHRFDLRAGRLLEAQAELVFSGSLAGMVGEGALEMKLRYRAITTGKFSTRNPLDD